MELTERKKKILQIVVDDYIETATPVSSRSITEKYLTTISSATVRSELAALEELGYLYQPHTSAGRVPSKEAYKLYVSELMVKDRLTHGELEYIKKVFLDRADNMETVLKSAVKVISQLTSLTTVAIASHEGTERLLNVKLVRLLPDKALLIIVTDTKILKDNIIDIPKTMSDEQLEDTNVFLAKCCKDKTIEEFCACSVEIEDSFTDLKAIFLNVIDALKEYVDTNGEVFSEGEAKICSLPEYADAEKIKNFLSVVTDKEKIFSIMADNDRDIKINIKVGSENSQMPVDCSLVSATYYANGVKLGTYGVIGPNRMDYQKVVCVLENVGKIIESILNKR